MLIVLQGERVDRLEGRSWGNRVFSLEREDRRSCAIIPVVGLWSLSVVGNAQVFWWSHLSRGGWVPVRCSYRCRCLC